MTPVIPEWVKDTIVRARNLYGVAGNEWFVSVRMTEAPGGDRDSDGYTKIDSEYYNANMELKSSLQNTQLDRETIHHEIFHMAFSELDEFIRNMIKELPPERQHYFLDRYIRKCERFTTKTVRNILAQIEGDIYEETEPASSITTRE